MKNSILTRLTILVSLVILFSLATISFSNYQMTYLRVKESAGIELYGCANITTGLLETDEILRLNSLTPSEAADLGEKISWTREHKPIFNNQYIMSTSGIVLVTDSSSQAQGIKEGNKVPLDEKVIQTITQSKTPTYSNVYEYAGMKRLTGYAPIFEDHDPNKDVVAISVIDFDAKILSERTWSMVSSTIIVGIISLLTAGIIIILYVRKTILPLRDLTEYTKRISQGDLSGEVQSITAKGEIKVLNENFNLMVANLQNAILKTVDSSAELSSSSEELSTNLHEVTNIAESVSTTFQEVAESAHQQERDSEKIQNVFQEILKETNRIGDRVNKTVQNTSDAAVVVSAGLEHISQSMEQMEHIQASTSDIARTMLELKEKSKKANEILTIIMNISKQTNLLALNASIESARAGEHGKGFSVVAEEVRKLAEETSQSVGNINAIIMEIDNKMEESVSLTEEGKRTVSIGIDKVKYAGQSFRNIHQSTTSLENEIQQILLSTNQIKEEIAEANSQIESIALSSKAISVQMQEVVAASEEQTASIEEVSAATQNLSKMAKDLKEMSQQFKLE